MQMILDLFIIHFHDRSRIFNPLSGCFVGKFSSDRYLSHPSLLILRKDLGFSICCRGVFWCIWFLQILLNPSWLHFQNRSKILNPFLSCFFRWIQFLYMLSNPSLFIFRIDLGFPIFYHGVLACSVPPYAFKPFIVDLF